MTALTSSRPEWLEDELAATRNLLRLRSQALGRTAEQLTAVRRLHTPNGSNRCRCCRETYPCQTAIASGVQEES